MNNIKKVLNKGKVLCIMLMLSLLITACIIQNVSVSDMSTATFPSDGTIISEIVQPTETILPIKATSISRQETPTELHSITTARPLATSTIMPTPLPPDMQALKNIVFSTCIPVEEGFPEGLEIPWNLLVMESEFVFIYDPEDGTKVEIPHLTEITPEYYYKFLEGFYISPDGKWLAYSDRSYKKLFIEPVETLLTNADTDRLFWEMDHWFEIERWVDNETLLAIYPPSERKMFHPTVFLNPFTREEYVFEIEELPNYLDDLMIGLITTHYRSSGNLAPDPNMRRIVYPARVEDPRYGIVHLLWDVDSKKPLAELEYLLSYINHNDPIWSQDGSDVLLMGPNPEFRKTTYEEWFLISSNGVIRQVTQFKQILQEASYYIIGASRSWNSKFLAFKFFYDEPDEEFKYIVLDLKTDPLEGYCIPSEFVSSANIDTIKWSPDSKYLVMVDTEAESDKGDVILVDVEGKIGYKIAKDLYIFDWIVESDIP